MTNINDIYLFVNFIADKYQSRAVSDAEFNTVIDAANLDLWKLKVGLPEEYQVNAPFARQAWQVSNKISDDMRYFITEVDIPKNTSDIFPYPANYGAFSSLRYDRILNKGCDVPDSRTRTIEVVADAELSERLDNDIISPTYDYPIAAWYGSGWKVFPSIISSIHLTYLRLPNTPYRNYTVNAQTDITTYSASGSTQLDYPKTLWVDFAYIVLKKLAINIREADLYQMAANRQLSGQ